MIAGLAILVALLCAAASARRLWFVANATWLHPEEALGALRAIDRADATGKSSAVDALRAAIADEPRADWERDLLEALAAPTPEARTALVNEQLGELDFRMQRWARVPRVCASIATSAGFLLATLVMRRGLAEADLSGETGDLVVRALVGDALTVAGFGIVGTAFCIAAMAQARRLVQDRAAAADRLVERLERG
jgi:hypothetical protein